MQFPSYTCLHIDRDNKPGGGVAIYYKSALQMTEIDKCSVSTADLGCLAAQHRDTCFVVVYRPLTGKFAKFCSLLESMLSYFLHQNTKIIIMRDIIIDLLSDTSNQRQLNNIIESYGCKNLISVPTRVMLHSSTLIDVCITNINQSHAGPGVFLANISDHSPLFCFL